MSRNCWALGALVTVVLSLPVKADSVASFTLPSGVSVRITEAPFVARRFKIKGCTQGSSQCLIGGRLPYGVTGHLPKTYVKEIQVTVGETTHVLDSSSMFDAWGARPLEHPGSIRYFGGSCVNQQHCQFRGIFSDGAGTFVAEWVVFSGLVSRTVLTGNGDIVHLIMKNIDPPFVYD
jgi:hypothetical protein